MWTASSLLVIFALLNFSNYTQALKELKDMNWEKSPASAWGEAPVFDYHHFDQKSVLLILNVANYTNNTEKTFIAQGVLLDNSRILTSYNPFKQFLNDPEKTEKIVVVLVTGVTNKIVQLKIVEQIVCGRQIAFSDALKNFPRSPLHDLMVLRMEEEIGIANASYHVGKVTWASNDGYFLQGQLGRLLNSYISLIAAPGDQIRGRIWICSLVFRYDEEEKVDYYDTIDTTIYEEDEPVLVDCEEWLPREWGFFICIRNIYNKQGLASGATLYTEKNLLFGIGSFAMFKNDTGILVFTDVRPYVDLIMQTCGDNEFT